MRIRPACLFVNMTNFPNRAGVEEAVHGTRATVFTRHVWDVADARLRLATVAFAAAVVAAMCSRAAVVPAMVATACISCLEARRGFGAISEAQMRNLDLRSFPPAPNLPASEPFWNAHLLGLPTGDGPDPHGGQLRNMPFPFGRGALAATWLVLAALL